MSPQDIDAIGGDNFAGNHTHDVLIFLHCVHQYIVWNTLAGDVQLARFYPVALGEGRVVDIHKAYAKQRIATRSSYEVGVKSIA